MGEAIPFKSSGPLPLSRLTELTSPIPPILPTVRKPVGKLPWKILPNGLHAAILDADNNTLSVCTIGIAEQIVSAVNSHLALYTKSAELELGLRCLQGGLHELDRTPRVKKLIRMAEYALGVGGGGND